MLYLAIVPSLTFQEQRAEAELASKLQGEVKSVIQVNTKKKKNTRSQLRITK
jgi:hypothetical protein